MSSPPFSASGYAGAAGREPEVDDGYGVAGEKLATLYVIAVQILAFKGGEGLHAAVCGHAHCAVQGFLSRCGIFFLQRDQLVLDIAYLFRFLLKQAKLVSRKLVLGGIYGLQEKVAVVFAVLLQGHALIRRHEYLFPERAVLGEYILLLLHELAEFVYRLFLAVCAACGKHKRQNQRRHDINCLFEFHFYFLLEFCLYRQNRIHPAI